MRLYHAIWCKELQHVDPRLGCRDRIRTHPHRSCGNKTRSAFECEFWLETDKGKRWWRVGIKSPCRLSDQNVIRKSARTFDTLGISNEMWRPASCVAVRERTRGAYSDDLWFWDSQQNSRIVVVDVIWCGETFSTCSFRCHLLRADLAPSPGDDGIHRRMNIPFFQTSHACCFNHKL